MLSVIQFLMRIACGFLLVFWVQGCAVDQVMTEMRDRQELNLPMPIKVQPCIDRTGTEVADLGAQATETFQEEFNATEEFTVEPDGRFVLVCEVTNFLPGNAVERWILPGSGVTVGNVSAMIQDSRTGEILIIIEGTATVGSGGLYTIGAWNYIVPTAVKNIVDKLQVWAKDNAAGTGGGENKLR
jgi:hypothetical protein